jgi:CHAT domain-containing protein
VVSEAAVKLTTVMLKSSADHPGAGRAEALRHSMLALMQDEKPKFAHPLFWAPFVVVGEGGTYAAN